VREADTVTVAPMANISATSPSGATAWPRISQRIASGLPSAPVESK
jgi:hypothetical protein